MQTFKTIETVIATKKELPDYLNNKFCSFNLNNEHCKKIFYNKTGEKFSVCIYDFKKVLKKKTVLKDIQKLKLNNKLVFKIKLADIYAKNIKILNGLYQFELVFKNKSYTTKTSLLGKHNITNIMLATSIALKLNIDIEKIIDKIAHLKPVEHRLELIKGRINILDDSYNCSIESAKCALEVLEKFEGEKMVCTPGIIEGGKEQENLNTQLAYMLKKLNSINLIVGKTNREHFKKVLSNDKTFYIDSLQQAKSYFNHLKIGSTLLLLNDLPDDYN